MVNPKNSNLRLAYLLVRFPTLYETYVYNEIYWLLQNGVKVQIYSARQPRPGPVHQRAREIANQIPVVYSALFSWAVFAANVYFLLNSPLKYIGALLWVLKTTYRDLPFMALALVHFPKAVYYARLMNEQGIDHIHVHFIWVQQVMAVVISRLIGVSNSVTAHAFDLYMRKPTIVREQLEATTRIITISEYNEQFIANLWPEINIKQIAVIRCGLDLDTFQLREDVPNNEVCQILSVGRLEEKKGYSYLLAACAILAQRGINFHWTIVGRGDDRNALEKLVKAYGLDTHVTFAGALATDDVRKLIMQSDLFALACVVASNGDRDGLPIVLLEAMATGLPVVTTPVTGIPELVVNDQNGFLVPERDTEALADALEMLIKDASLRTKFGNKARERVVQEHNSQHNTLVLLELFKETVSGRVE